MHLLELRNAEMGQFRARLLRKGEPYGLQHQLRYDKDEPLVEFYGPGDSEFEPGTFWGRWGARRFLRPVAGWLTLEWGFVCLISEDNQQEIASWLEPLLREPWTPPPPPPRPESQKRAAPTDLHYAGDRRATLYLGGLFGFSKLEADWVQVYRQPYAQYADAVFAEYKPRGKRLARRATLTSHLDLVVLLGWDHPPLQETFVDDYGPGGLTGKATKYTSADRRYAEEFEEALDAYLAENPLTRVLLDLRGEKTTERIRQRAAIDNAPVPMLSRGGELVRARRPEGDNSDRLTVFVSYYHLDNAADRDRFERETGTVIRSVSIYPGEISPQRSDDAIRREIRARISRCEYLIVLIGRNTYTRRWVDWEIRAALSGSQTAAHKPVVGVLLPEAAGLADLVEPHIGTAPNEPSRSLQRKSDDLSRKLLSACGMTLPARLLDNLLTGFATLRQWPGSAQALVDSLREANTTDAKPANARRIMATDLTSPPHGSTSTEVDTADDPSLKIVEPPPAAELPEPPEPQAAPAAAHPEPMTGATILAVMAQLTAAARQRFVELAVFASGATIPESILSRLWKTTGGWNAAQTSTLCKRLVDLGLAEERATDSTERVLVLADALTAQCKREAGDRVSELHRLLLDAHRPATIDENGDPEWSTLPTTETYLWTWVPTHLAAGGRTAELRRCMLHPQWLVGKLLVAGPSAVESDLGLVDDPTLASWRILVGRHAHLLDPLDSPTSLAATLAARLPGDGWAAGMHDLHEALTRLLGAPHLVPIAPLPDLPPQAQIRVLRGGAHSLVALVTAPDGRWLAAADYEGTIRIWDNVTGIERHTLSGHTRPTLGRSVEALASAPDGTWLASAGDDGLVLIWDPLSGKLLHTLTTCYGKAKAVAVDPAGTWLAAVDAIDMIQLWDMPAGTLRHTVRAVGTSVTGLMVDPAGQCLVAFGWSMVRRWDPLSGTELEPLGVPRQGFDAMAADPAGSWLAGAGGSGTIRLWRSHDPAAPKDLVNRARTIRKQIRALVAEPAGKWLASGSEEGIVRIWDPATGAKRHTLAGHRAGYFGVSALAVGPDGAWLASSGSDGVVRVWDPSTAAELQAFTGHSGSVAALTMDPAGTWLASAGSDGTVRLWNPAVPATRMRTGTPAPIQALTATADGAWFAYQDRHGNLCISDAETTRQAPGNERNTPHALLADPSGAWLASAGNDGEIRIWDPRVARERLFLIGRAHKDRPEVAWRLATDAAGQFLVCGGRMIRVWSPVVGEKISTMPAPDGHVRALAVDPNAAWLAAGGKDGTVEISGLPDGERRHRIHAHSAAVKVLAVNSSGSDLVSGGEDGVVRVWEPHTGIEKFACDGHGAAEHGGVTAVAFDPHGSWIASGGSDHTVRIWDPSSGIARHVLAGHRGSVRALAVEPTGRFLASVGVDGTIWVWDPSAGSAVASLRVAGKLNHVEWTARALIAGGDCGLYQFALKS